MPGSRSSKPPIKISVLEKNEGQISHCWKTCQIFSYVLVIVSGIATCLAIGTLRTVFQQQCILYANLTISDVSGKNITLGQLKADSWGSTSTCDFTQFSHVASAIFAGIWATFFLMCGKGGTPDRHLPSPWRIVFPALIFSLIFLVISSVTSGTLIGGFSSFCSNLKMQGLNISRCEELMQYSWTEYPSANKFYDEVIIAETGTIICLTGWFLGFIILFLRCMTHADFEIKPIMIPRHSSSQSQDSILSSLGSSSCASSTTSGSNQMISPSKKTKLSIQSETNPLINTNGSGSRGSSKEKSSEGQKS